MINEIQAKSLYQRISPSKVMRVADKIRGLQVQEALAILKNLPHSAAIVLYKVIKSASANATNNFNKSQSHLYIKTVLVNEAPRLKRFRPRARGRMDQIIKRNCHVIVGLSEVNN